MPINISAMMAGSSLSRRRGVSSSSGLGICALLCDALVPAPSVLCELESDFWSSCEQLVAKGVQESKRRINAAIVDGHSFYIGITENPVRRWDEHLQADSMRWMRMDLLVRARSSAITAPIEKALVGCFKNVFLCHNLGHGGEHASAGMPHYVYLLIGRPLHRRR